MILEVEKPGSGDGVQEMEVEEEKETKTTSRIFDEVSKIKINEKLCEEQVTSSFYEKLCRFLHSDVLSLCNCPRLSRRNFLSF